MDTVQWPQDIVMKPLEEMVQTTATKSERKIIRPQKEQALNCPRCNSTNTKFCYYNNYSLSQPRYFCKTCRRYWTEGGSLRNIPVGGGSRRNKRSSSSSSSNTNSSTLTSTNSDHHHLLIQNPKFPDVQDLNLGFPPSSSSSATTTHHQDFKTISELIQVPNFDNSSTSSNNNTNNSLSCSNSSSISAMGLNSFLTMPIGGTGFSSGGLMIPMPPPHDFKPTLNFSLDGLGIISNGGNGGNGGGHVQETTSGGVGRLLFPFEDLKQSSSNDADRHHHQQQQHQNNNRDHNAAAGNYWNGVLGGNGGGGGSW